MKKNDFFKNAIKDNNYEGISLSLIGEVNKKGQFSQSKIFQFLKDIEMKFASKEIKYLINTYSFGEEFEANEDQKFFEVKGEDFDSAKIYTFNIVGSIIYKKNTFNVNSRFGDEFLQYMIASSHGFLELEESGGISKNINIAEWLMLYYFKIKLKAAFGLGVYKTYTSKQDNLNKVRGSIDINNYIKKEYFDGKVRCNYKEHSYSNEINYVISLAINKIFKNSKYTPIVKDILTIKNAFNQIEYKKQNIKSIKNYKVKNPFYSKYNEVFQLALDILDDNFGGNGEDDFSAFLFDISLLFEHHIRALLKIKLKLDDKNKKEFKIPNGCSENHIYPDIVIHNDDGSVSIYDVKYKHFANGVNREDRFQLVSYIALYLHKYKVRECGFIYPKKSNMKYENVKTQTLKIAQEEIPFKIVFYNIFEVEEQSKDKDRFTLFKSGQEEKDKVFLKTFLMKDIK